MKKHLFIPAVVAVSGLCGCSFDFGDNYYVGDYFPEVAGENYAQYEENPFVSTAEQPVSTFSVDADGGSFANVRRILNQGTMPPKYAVRIEEFLNYFTFDYPAPSGEENLAVNAEMSTCPWHEGHHVLRLGIRGKDLDDTQRRHSNYVFLIDVSGSMYEDLPVLKEGFCRLMDSLSEDDFVSIVVYAGADKVILGSTPVSDGNRAMIKSRIRSMEAGGSTAGAAGIKTAYELAQENFIEGGNNRIILGSDGDFNVGMSSVEELKELISTKRDSGIYLTTLGVGYGNYNDAMMEQLADCGDGTYEYIDSPEEIERVFVENFCRFFPAADDVKIQVSFNPEAVDSYRLIGYENRLLENDDFEDDGKDAGEIGSGQTITALYELILKPGVNQGASYLTFDVRYKKPGQSESRPVSLDLKDAPAAWEDASENMRFALSVGAFGLILRQSEYRGDASYSLVYDLGRDACSFDPYGHRSRFFSMVDKAEAISGR